VQSGKIVGWSFIVLAILGAGFWVYLGHEAAEEKLRVERDLRSKAVSQCQRWAEKLDAQTTDTGVYERWPTEELPEVDPWGHKLRVLYSQGGVAETVTVRSAGPDGEWHTADDIATMRFSANLKGIGNGIKKNAEETTANAARGLVKGVAEQVRKERKGEKE